MHETENNMIPVTIFLPLFSLSSEGKGKILLSSSPQMLEVAVDLEVALFTGPTLRLYKLPAGQTALHCYINRPLRSYLCYITFALLPE